MRSLGSLLEGILDADFDINDGAILDDVVRKAMDVRYDHDLPGVTADGEWLTFDCANTRKEAFFVTLAPFREAGYFKYRFINCTLIELYKRYGGEGHWDGVEIDAPNSSLTFSNNNNLTLDGFTANVRHVDIDANDSDDMKIIMKNCKFDTAYIKTQAVTRLSISSNCKFPNCKLLYLGRVGKLVVKRANDLLFCDVSNGESFKRQVYRFEPADETVYWDIDVMKTLGLKSERWPDLGKIVIVPNGIPASSAPAICLYNTRKTMLPISKRCNDFIPEYKDYWKGSLVSKGLTELNCVTK